MSQAAKARIRRSLIRCLAPVADASFRERPRIRVLSFHDVPLERRDEFLAKIEWLDRNYRVVSLSSAYGRVGLDEEHVNVALTFDDGFAEHATFVAPQLEERGLPATFFVPSGALDLSPDEAERFASAGLRRRGSFRFMSSGELSALASKELFEIGGHTVSHADIGALDQTRLDDEIVSDKATVESLCGRPALWFAFPFGSLAHVSGAALATIERAGYKAAFSIVPGFWSRAQNPYIVGRDCLAVEDADDLWAGWLRGGYDAVSWVKHRRSPVAGR